MPQDAYGRVREICYDFFLVMAGLSLIILVIHLITLPFPTFPSSTGTTSLPPVQPSKFEQIRAWSEVVYFWSGPLLLVVAMVGLRQITIAKSDVSIRNERAAKEKAIEQGSRWGSVTIPLLYEAWDFLRRYDLEPYEGDVGEFSENILSETDKKKIFDAMNNSNVRRAVLLLVAEIETVSASCLSGVSDDGLGFKVFGSEYCSTVSSLYHIISAGRTSSLDNVHTIELYKLWSGRLNKAELAKTRRALDEQIASIKDTPVQPIGVAKGR